MNVTFSEMQKDWLHKVKPAKDVKCREYNQRKHLVPVKELMNGISGGVTASCTAVAQFCPRQLTAACSMIVLSVAEPMMFKLQTQDDDAFVPLKVSACALLKSRIPKKLKSIRVRMP